MKSEQKARKAVNEALWALCLTYHPWIPNQQIDAALTSNGFNPLAEGIYCGRDGRISEQVGERTWFTMTWHKMESGRYEIVAYVN